MRYLLLILLTTCLYADPIDGSVIYPEDDGKKAALSSCKAGDCQPLAVSKGRRDDDEPSPPPPPKPKSALLDSITVSLPYAVEHYEAPAKVEPTYEMPRHWHPGDDHGHGHHGQVPEPATWALIGCGLMAVAWRRR